MAVDARVRYTKMIIKESFVELLKLKQLNKITVKEVCDLAEINRSTFYKYYKDVFDLFDKLTDELQDEFFELLKKIKEKGEKEALIEALEKIKKNKDVYLTLLLSVSGNDIISNTFSSYYDKMLQESVTYLKNISQEKRIWLVHYLSFGSSGILLCWVNNGMQESSEKIADIIIEFVSGTLKSVAE